MVVQSTEQGTETVHVQTGDTVTGSGSEEGSDAVGMISDVGSDAARSVYGDADRGNVCGTKGGAGRDSRNAAAELVAPMAVALVKMLVVALTLYVRALFAGTYGGTVYGKQSCLGIYNGTNNSKHICCSDRRCKAQRYYPSK